MCQVLGTQRQMRQTEYLMVQLQIDGHIALLRTMKEGHIVSSVIEAHRGRTASLDRWAEKCSLKR